MHTSVPNLQKRNVVYAYPKLSRYDLGVARLFGPGLGNLLFPWARCTVVAEKFGMAKIAPTWPQLKIGPFIRGEKDKRTYCDLFQKQQDELGGTKKLKLLLSAHRISEREFERWRAKGQEQVAQDILVVFEGMANYFSEILHESELIKARLLEITREKHKKSLGFVFSNSISVHVRVNDFRIAGSSQKLTSGGESLRIPDTWYVKVLSQLRNAIGFSAPVYVISDGTNSELAELLTLPRVQRLSFGSSIGDLLALSRSNILVTSGSTFSMWATYLGRMPAIWHKGQLRQRLYHDRPELELELDGPVPEDFIAQVRKRFTSTASRY